MLEKSLGGTTDATTADKFPSVATPLASNTTSVKFATGLPKPIEGIAILSQPSKAAALQLPPTPHRTIGRTANSNWGYHTHRTYRIKQPSVIPTGPLTGLSKRRTTNRTKALDIEQVRALANAHSFARSIGRPFTAVLTVTWRFSPQFTEAKWPRLQTRLMDKTTRFLATKGITTAFAWTRERSTCRGAHTHIALHLGWKPKTICQELLTYLNSAFQFSPDGLVIRMGAYGALTEKMQAGNLIYLVKGLDHSAFRYNGGDTENIGDLLGINHRGQQGLITIKRAGVSQNVSQKARKKAGWQDIRDFEGLRRILHPTTN